MIFEEYTIRPNNEKKNNYFEWFKLLKKNINKQFAGIDFIEFTLKL